MPKENKKGCCEKCRKKDGATTGKFGEVLFYDYCADSTCPCHTPTTKGITTIGEAAKIAKQMKKHYDTPTVGFVEDKIDEFKKKYPQFRGVGAKHPIFNETPVYTHVINFLRTALNEAYEKGKIIEHCS